MDLDGYSWAWVWGNDEVSSSVHRLTNPDRPTLFVKSAPTLQREHERLVWASGRLPVPDVVDFVRHDGGDQLVTLAIPGDGAHDRDAVPDTWAATEALAAAWKLVHELPVDDCPFDTSPDALLAAAERSLTLAAPPDVWDHDRMRSARDVFDELVRTRPRPLPPVVVHGDAAVPNALVHNGKLSGIVDLGLLGVGDPWWDITACLGSMSRPDNGLGHERAHFLAAYGVEEDPDRERWHRLLYRMTFDLPDGLSKA